MEMSEQINELATALAKAQMELGNAKKSSDNPYFKSRYADLAEVLDTCREVLGKNGLSVIQPVGVVNDKAIEVTTMLIHSSGQWVKSTTNMPMVKLDPQAAGSAITYARRYSLAAMVGISQADDDGEGALGRGKKEEKPANLQKAEQVFGCTAKPVEGYVRKTADSYEVRSKNNNRWADVRAISLERLNDMINDKDYAEAHQFIFEVMKNKTKSA